MLVRLCTNYCHVGSPFIQIETCDICQRINRKLTAGVPELHPVKVHSPWFHLGIDFVGPLPIACDGSRYILTTSDYFTKWVEAVATPNKEATTVAEILFKVWNL